MKEIKLLLIGIVLILAYSCIEQKQAKLFTKSKVQRLVSGKGNNTLLEINEEVFKRMFSEKKDNEEIEIPFEDEILKLRLRLLSDNYSVNTTNFDFTGHVAVIKPVSYEGFVIDDADSSFASITITTDNFFGFISSDKYGTFTLEKKKLREYLISKSVAETQDTTISFICGTIDTLKKIEFPIMSNPVQRLVSNKCITLDYEVVHNDYLRLGTVQNVVNWINQMFSSVRALYSKEGWTLSIKSIYVHTSPDGYSLQTDIALEQLKERRKNDPLFTGTFLQLIQSVNGGAMGGIAYVGAMCNNDYNVSVAQVLPNSGSLYPSYSWNINVMSHELGHNCGSPHTHSCVWPGGAIDNCYTPEGSCSPGATPINGGTVMSYCHLKQSIGMNMANGFGEKPHALIESKIAAASCLACSVVIDTVKPVPPPSSGYGLISLNKPANQSTTYVGGFAYPYKGEQPVQSFPANLANDNSKVTFSRTDREVNPRLSIDLQATCNIKRVVIVPRVDCCYNLANFNLTVDNSLAFTRNGSLIRDSITIDLDMKGRIISLNANQSWYNTVTGTYLQISDFKIYGSCGTVVSPPPCTPKDTTYKVWRLIDSTGKICR